MKSCNDSFGKRKFPIKEIVEMTTLSEYLNFIMISKGSLEIAFGSSRAMVEN